MQILLGAGAKPAEKVFAKQYNLILVKGRRCTVAEKVMACLAKNNDSHNTAVFMIK